MPPRPPAPPPAHPRWAGFTLTELLIGLAVSALLAALAYPAYTGHLARTRRDDGRQGLFLLASGLEQHRQRHGSFAGAQVAPAGVLPAASPAGHYQLQVLDATAEGYRLAAVPSGPQAADACATLTYDHLGQGGSSAVAPGERCWP